MIASLDQVKKDKSHSSDIKQMTASSAQHCMLVFLPRHTTYIQHIQETE